MSELESEFANLARRHQPERTPADALGDPKSLEEATLQAAMMDNGFPVEPIARVINFADFLQSLNTFHDRYGDEVNIYKKPKYIYQAIRAIFDSGGQPNLRDRMIDAARESVEDLLDWHKHISAMQDQGNSISNSLLVCKLEYRGGERIFSI
jgi:hypothetical protein